MSFISGNKVHEINRDDLHIYIYIFIGVGFLKVKYCLSCMRPVIRLFIRLL